MIEIRDIVERMLDSPQPPHRPVDEVLAIARRDKRRRSWAAAIGFGAATLALVLAVAGMLHPPVDEQTPTSPSVAAPAPPMARAAAAHGALMAERLKAALPAGFAAGSVETFSDATLVQPTDLADGRVRILAAAVVRVFDDAGEGEVFAYVVHDGRPARGEGCAAAAPTGQGRCEMVTVDGVTVRVVAAADQVRGGYVAATRLLDGGHLIVGAWQGPAPRSHTGSDNLAQSPLAAAPWDVQTVAALAADQTMLP
jgi:hypothetical protein